MEADRRADNSGTTITNQTRRKSSQKEKIQQGRKASVNRPVKEHTFLTDVADVRTMEHGLLQLLNDFHSGKLQAFGNTATFNKMDAIRVQQEQLAKTHFEMDLIPRSATNRLSTEESRKENNEKMEELVAQLHKLSVSVQTLQTDRKNEFQEE
ncbi:coiled-coil domain-containing protein 28B-like [Physella acuta]|uniref:coiled-coil domain-containing protein 28B-like n=1 Tax=Physella acuta TaxID=109671 RepID=UPI0027DD3E1C|nr:coiled-coil domain-containing protein 28B-like [Physella acuta]XP_059150141.1 coiled-coil domain-containing protein 28B-like [Physella acuta]XP_059150142.1 coiled-coil domain-containing protein 28B-like [Physella acuta]XP_059150143.1 coiled-coil domain-containing protein 28B-like [Physella acuta]XP_059150144.1 coiled-coil domain-containing protein 28B-like [Physella acuta]